MNEVDYERDRENEAFGRFLIESIANHLGCDPDPKLIDGRVYRNTACGAWCKFDAEGVMVGTIVEGSDAEFSERISLAGIEPSDDGARLLVERFDAALQRCEEFSDEVWDNMAAEE